MELEELKKLKNSMQEATHTFDDTIKQEINQLQEITKTPAVSVPPPEVVTGDKSLTEFNTTQVGPASQPNLRADDAGNATFK
jgi:hypothetical protein